MYLKIHFAAYEQKRCYQKKKKKKEKKNKLTTFFIKQKSVLLYIYAVDVRNYLGL